jgi:hypothetical protein
MSGCHTHGSIIATCWQSHKARSHLTAPKNVIPQEGRFVAEATRGASKDVIWPEREAGRSLYFARSAANICQVEDHLNETNKTTYRVPISFIHFAKIEVEGPKKAGQIQDRRPARYQPRLKEEKAQRARGRPIRFPARDFHPSGMNRKTEVRTYPPCFQDFAQNQPGVG